MEVEESQPKEEISEKSEKLSRKRRRSEMEEASFLTIISSSTKEKKKKKEGKNEDAPATDRPRRSGVAARDTGPEEAKKDEANKNSNEDLKESESQASTADSGKEEQQEVPKVPTEKEVEIPAPKVDDKETTSSTEKEEVKQGPKLKPIKLVISTKSNKIIGRTIGKATTHVVSPKVMPIKIRQAKFDKSLSIAKISKDKDHKEVKSKSHKRRNSKNNKLLNNSNSTNSEKLPENNAETVQAKDKKDSAAMKSKTDEYKTVPPAPEKPNPPKPNTESPKPAKDRIQFDDDDTSLAVIAREVKGSATNTNVSGLPTISSVRSLSTAARSPAPSSKNNAKTIEVSIEPNENSLLIPTSVANIRKEPTRPKDSEPSMIGRVGVRAFARMASPEPQRSKDVEVEIKAEPIDFEDQDRQLEKLDMMKAFKLRPVNAPPSTNLREVSNSYGFNEITYFCYTIVAIKIIRMFSVKPE